MGINKCPDCGADIIECEFPGMRGGDCCTKCEWSRVDCNTDAYNE